MSRVWLQHGMLALGGASCLLTGFGCEAPDQSARETPEGYEITKGAQITLLLESPLSSNRNQRGDEVRAHMEKPLRVGAVTVLPEGTVVRGLVKRVDPFQKFGDRASLLLLFDQLVLPDGRLVPIVASLDTKLGAHVIKIQGQAVKNARIMSHSALAGTLIGDSVIQGQGAQKGLAIGAGLGSGAIFQSEAREVTLPEGTALIIKLDEPVWIPK